MQHLYGSLKLSNDPRVREPSEEAIAFVFSCVPEEFFDFLELIFRLDLLRRQLSDENELVDAINQLFHVEDAPYQLTPMVKVEEPNPVKAGNYGEGGTIIRTVAWPKVVRAEDEITHAEAIAPALSTLSAPHFEAANIEFRDALEEYRKGHYGDCLTKCGSALESVLTILCKRNAWQFDENKSTVGPLLKTVLSHSTLETFFEQPLMLIATMRNNLSIAHGGGTQVRIVKRHVAQYTITSTAAAIVLLINEVGS